MTLRRLEVIEDFLRQRVEEARAELARVKVEFDHRYPDADWAYEMQLAAREKYEETTLRLKNHREAIWWVRARLDDATWEAASERMEVAVV